jgi:hypothetical protein
VAEGELRVYHFSENPTIAAFAPRPSRLGEDLVWAIDAWHQAFYWLPRDCPRVCFWPDPGRTTPDDEERWWSTVSGRMVIAVEAAWLDRIRTCRLYRYSFDGADFATLDDNGMYVSRRAVRPLAVEPLGDLLGLLVSGGVELRLCPSLVPLGRAVIASTLDFSLIRMRNAAGWAEGPSQPRT